MTKPTVGFVGLGRIGFPVALHIARAGFPMRAFDLAPRPEYANELQDAGAEITTDLASLAQGAEVIVTLLPDSKAVESVLLSDDLAPHLHEGMLCIDMSTGYPDDTIRLADSLAPQGVELIDAPICKGGVRGAYAGALTLCIGGSPNAIERARPVLEPVAATLVPVGTVGMGHIIKLVSNFVALGVAGLISEAYAVALAGGFDYERAASVLEDCVAGRYVNLPFINEMLMSDADGSEDGAEFTVRLARKDLRYLTAFAARSGVFTPIADGAHQEYLVAELSGLADSEATLGPWMRASGPAPSAGA